MSTNASPTFAKTVSGINLNDLVPAALFPAVAIPYALKNG